MLFCRPGDAHQPGTATGHQPAGRFIMHLIHVGGIALNQTPLDWNGNRDRIIAALDVARQRGLSVVCVAGA